MFQINQPEASCDWHMCPRRISHQKFPKRRRILSILSKAHSFHSLHSDIGRMNGTILRSFQKRNSSPKKNTNTVYSEYSYSGINPKECVLGTLYHLRFFQDKNINGFLLRTVCQHIMSSKTGFLLITFFTLVTLEGSVSAM